MKRSILAGAGLAIATAGLIAGPAQAAGPNTCVYNPTSKIVSVNLLSGGFTQLEMEGNTLVTFDAFGKGVCKSASGVIATKANTASVLMIGTASKEDFIVSYMGGTYDGGAAGGSNPDKIEINILSDASDTVDVAGTNGPDLITISGGTGTSKAGNITVNNGLNSTPGIKMTFNPKLVRVHGLDGNDLIAGRVFMPPTTMLLELDGDGGQDSLIDGFIGGDRLDGGAGNDTLDSRDGQAFDVLVGGPDFDVANMERNDQAVQVEQVPKTVGKLAAHGARS